MIEAVGTPRLRRQPAPRTALGLTARFRVERFAVGLSAVVIALLPLALPIGPGNSAPIDVLLVIGIGGCLLWAWTTGHRWRLPYAIPVGLLIVGGALGALRGPVPSLGITAIAQDVLLLAWCAALVNISHSAANLRTLMAAWSYSAIGWATLLFVGLTVGSPLLTGQTARQGSRVQLTFGDPNYLANYFFISMMVIWATALPRRRWVRLAAYIALLAGIAFTGSISGIVEVTIGTTVAGLLGVYRRVGLVQAVALLAALTIGGCVAAATISPESIQNAGRRSSYSFIRDGIGRSAQTGGDHALIVREGLRLYKAGGPLGEGPVSTKVLLRAENAPRVKEAHNDYVAALVERGVLGFLGVLILVASIGFRTASIGTRGIANGYSAVVKRPNALAGAVAGTLAAGVVYEFLHVRHVWALFGLVAGLYIWGRR